MLNLIAWLLGLIVTAVSAFTFVPYVSLNSILYYILILLGSYVGFILLFFIFAFILSLNVSLKKEYKQPNKFKRVLLYLAVDYAVRFIRINAKVINKHLMPKESCFIVQNHLNATDPVITIEAIHKQGHIVMISKKENFKIPLLGKYMHRACFQALDRENPRQAIKTINESARLIYEENINVCVYPEGTRNKSNDTLLEFKDGCFKVALKAKCPIVVTTLRNSKNIFKWWPFKKAGTILTIVKVIPYEEYKDMNTKQISDIVRDIMFKDLEQ